MRIAIVAPLISAIAEPQAGGAQAIVADLAAGLTRRGHDVDLFAATGSWVAGVRVINTGIDASALSDALVRPGRDASRRTDAVTAAFRRTYDLVAADAYDVVHNHGFDAAAIELAVHLPCRVVHTLHMAPDAEIGAALQAAREGARPPLVVAVSAAEAEAWAPLVDVDAVVRNGVDVGAIPWSAEPGAGAVFAARLSPEKGALEAIEICRRAEMPLTLFGPTYDADYAAEAARMAGAMPGARLEPALPRPELWRRMAAAAVVVCPSMWDEPFGLVPAEAQAAGTPVVGFRRGGLAEVVLDGTTGALVAPGDIDMAAAAVRGAGAFRRDHCRRHAEQRLDISRTIEGYEALYAGA
jgi:glycosyltransferase involved in cell wall biosynthesis